MEKVTIEKLVFGGQGLARKDGRVYFVWNALPGEEVEVEITKKKKNFCEGIARKIIKASPLRVEPKEAHFLACSPWQIMSFDSENDWKKKIALETYLRFRALDKEQNIEIEAGDKDYGYRNKIEYRALYADGQLKLAFYGRETNQLF